MTAATLPFDTGELVNQCAEASAPKRLRLRAMLWVAAAPTLVLDAMSRGLVLAMDSGTRRVARHTLAIEGLTERICASPPGTRPIDPDDVLYTKLLASEGEQRKSAQQMRDLKRPTGRHGQRVYGALVRMCLAAEAHGDAVRDLRAAIQAHDANVDTLRRLRGVGAGACQGAEELDGSLKSAFEDA